MAQNLFESVEQAFGQSHLLALGLGKIYGQKRYWLGVDNLLEILGTAEGWTRLPPAIPEHTKSSLEEEVNGILKNVCLLYNSLPTQPILSRDHRSFLHVIARQICRTRGYDLPVTVKFSERQSVTGRMIIKAEVDLNNSFLPAAARPSRLRKFLFALRLMYREAQQESRQNLASLRQTIQQIKHNLTRLLNWLFRA